MNQAYLTRAVYVSIYGPDSTAQNREDPVAFASKMQSALGAGGSFLMKRTAIEIADFERDLRRLKDIPKDLTDFGRLFREFWDKDEDKQLGPSEMWEKTRNIRYQGVTFWKLPVLQLLHLPKGTTIGPGSYRFTGKLVPFLVGMVVLLRMNLRMELNRAYQRAAKGLGNIGSESPDDEESDALPIDSAPLDAMKRVIHAAPPCSWRACAHDGRAHIRHPGCEWIAALLLRQRPSLRNRRSAPSGHLLLRQWHREVRQVATCCDNSDAATPHHPA
jgi:hypothetical protein